MPDRLKYIHLGDPLHPKDDKCQTSSFYIPKRKSLDLFVPY